MFKIGKVFHLTHVVEDLDAVDRWYDEVFDCERYYKGLVKVAAREASLLVIGDMVMEPVQLAREVPGAHESPIGRFLERFGEHFHSIAWYVDDLRETVGALAEAGIRQVDISGRRIDPVKAQSWTDPAAHAIWTHPRDTHALLEFSEPGFALDPRLAPDWSADRWREHPLGITGTSHLTVTFEDLEQARPLYAGVLGGREVGQGEAAEGPSLRFALGEGIVEALQPATGTAAAGDLERAGEGVYAITFAVADIGRAAEFLTEKGQVIERLGGGDLVIRPEHAFGMTVGFTERPLSP